MWEFVVDITNPQAIFDHVLAHARAQATVAWSPETGCAYRTPAGLKCFGGALISDTQAIPAEHNQGTNWGRLIELGFAPPDNKELISALQTIHDANPPSHWEDALHDIAYRFGLVFTPLKEQ